ncbi:MAG: NYN domain-containing protein [Gemmataceae bacterium]|nr:NYN domain-containing protein [Gemmataceae bacterium]
MRVPPSAVRRQPRLARGRRLVLVDIENIAGGACTTDAIARQARDAVAATGQIGITDHVVIGTSHIGLIPVGTNWDRARYVVRSGRDGADLALLEVIAENVVTRFESVVLASGDRIFAPAVADLAAAGVATTVIGRRGHIARALHQAAARVIYLDHTPDARAAA